MSGITAIARNGIGTITLAEEVFSAFRTGHRGPCLTAADQGYDDARVIWNGSADKRPAIIARCSGAADVIDAVKFARQHDLLVAVRAVGDGMLPRLAEVEIDGSVLAFTIGISLLTSLVFGAAPALHAARTDLAATMKSLGKASTSRSSVSTRDVLVVAQVALSVVLLIGAGLLVRSLWRLQDVKTGFDPSRLVAVGTIEVMQHGEVGGLGTERRQRRKRNSK